MNYRYDTSMMPQADLLRVCLSCWRRIPSQLSRQILHHKYPATSAVTCNGQCGKRWTSMLTLNSKQFSTSSKPDDIDSNPFFEKYKQKLKHMQEENPEEYESRLQEMKEKLKPKKEDTPQEPPPQRTEPPPKRDIPGFSGPRTWPPKSLDEIMKLELIKDLDAKAITQLWQEYHIAKDCIFSVFPTEHYDELISKSQINPNFIFTLPKGDGYEFYLCQFSGKDVYFTPLAMYQLVKENAPPCLTVAHFPELKDDKGIVLMAGEYDDKVIRKTEALNLVKQMTLYYGRDAGERYKLVRTFHTNPEQFQYMDIIEQYKMNKEFLENNPY
ncbi:ATP synthase mitochondrial F1 complex assembly factor 1-like [Mercenaria mercenaria]|uniref:ATP synthase mitochondrial F1 complex assembly factor 1-like n=1 Tax=Mercenaria mercenaria TaxID=6596 RepID=UPI00234E4C2B|nr:ATP synthase mitochondrial F1 complex assembly factor 1-like [Mercenaria mercenaria]XP_053395061.1 ATP synthase mitochondrial F1 complex assembly factor 1-like [Mercenaria mercenaria]XP_053395062.1 ATP synthase mitochondrial F1 complex assembly factor 1-like [Mercenaria mercenaria]XP_053395063.1 ATP synthase mitochondrial F1 complex assembly factor 1-like [Mercenaria mercenaria]